jgi:hypothetical protein
MDYFAGLDVSLETVSICIVNAAGDVLLEERSRRNLRRSQRCCNTSAGHSNGLGLKRARPRLGFTASSAALVIQRSVWNVAM